MDNFFDNQRIIQVIWKRKFHFVIVGIIAVILSAIFSGPIFLKPRFRSTARIYPTNIKSFSEESETEQMLEIMNSKDITFRMFDTFNLDKVYKIDKRDPQYTTFMLEKYSKNVSSAKTKFETVEIKVLDQDPQRASDMCDSIVQFYNEKVRSMHKAKAFEMVDILGKELAKKQQELDEVTGKIDELREDYDVLDFILQAERVTEGYVKALGSGSTSSKNLAEIKRLYDNLAAKGTLADNLKSRHLYLLQTISDLTTEYDTYLSEYQKVITYAHIVEYPIPADKKAWPVRWLIVALSLIGSLFIALITFVVLDYQKKE